MSENSKIEWCDHTFSPWEGCQKVGPGCDNCYAEARNARFGGGKAANWGPGAPRRHTSESNWKLPLKWNKQAGETSIRPRVFCASLADVFDNAVPVEWRMDLFKLIADTPNLDWLILTKRIGNVMQMCSGDSLMFDMISDRVWLGATIVNQEEANRDIPKLLAVPARVRFLSMEPLLGPVDLRVLNQPDGSRRDGLNYGLHWVIVGGESGPGARPMHPDWARSLRDQCQAASVPYLFKQWGEWLPGQNDPHPTWDDGRRVAHHQDGRWGPTKTRVNDTNYVRWDGSGNPHAGSALNGPYFETNQWAERVGKKAAGRLLDGSEWNGAPT